MPSVAITRPYEAVYIVDPEMGEEQVTAITDRYKQIVETNGGTVATVDVWERRKLAYEIKGRSEGIYVIMHFSGPAKAESELRRIFQISEDQIRAMIVRQDETMPPLPAAETEASAAPAAAAPAASVEVVPAAEPTTPEEVVPTAEPPAPVSEDAPAAVTEPDAPALAPEQAPAE